MVPGGRCTPSDSGKFSSISVNNQASQNSTSRLFVCDFVGNTCDPRGSLTSRPDSFTGNCQCKVCEL